MARFLDRSEFESTYDLAYGCFDDKAFLDEFYSKDIYDFSICAEWHDDQIVSMAMYKTFWFNYSQDKVPATYLMMVCTHPDYRHRGLMSKVIETVCGSVETDYAFLIPVDPDIYRKLGFVYQWTLSERERELLYADDGLVQALAKKLNEKEFRKPDGIE